MASILNEHSFIELEQDPSLGELFPEVIPGVKGVDMPDLVARLKSYEEIQDLFKRYTHIGMMPPVNPHLFRGVDYAEWDEDKITTVGQRYSGFNVLYCHGRDGMERDLPVDDWMLRTTADPAVRDVPVLGIVERLLEKGERIDVLLICNKGGYPKDASKYPFLQNMLYPTTTAVGELAIYRDDESLVNAGGNIILPENWNGLIDRLVSHDEWDGKCKEK